MITNDIEQKLLEALKEIELSLNEKVMKCDEGIYWQTFAPRQENKVHQALDLYNGNAGIALFYLNLYQYSGKHAHLEVVKQVCGCLLSRLREKMQPHVAFYTGVSGVIYLLVLLHRHTHEGHWLEEALELTCRYKVGFEGHYCDDLLSGNAGNIFVLNELFLASESDLVMELLRRCIDDLLANTYLSMKGIKWGYHENYVDCLCGFSHGAAGIGHVLLEVAHAQNSIGLMWLATKAFDYEDQYFGKAGGLWPDLRIDPDHLTGIADIDIPLERLHAGAETNAWSHGGIGVGLSRLNAFLRTGQRRFYEQTRVVLEHTRSLYSITRSSNFTLSHGWCGMGYLYAMAGTELGVEAYSDLAVKIALDAIACKERLGHYPSGWDVYKEDADLFNGISGIGAYFLYLLTEGGTEQLVCPRSSVSFCPLEDFYPVSEVRGKIWQRHFPGSYGFIRNGIEHHVSDEPVLPEHLAFHQHFLQACRSLPEKDAVDAGKVHQVELNKAILMTKPLSVAYLRLAMNRNKHIVERLASMDHEQLCELQLRAGTHNLLMEGQEHCLLFFRMLYGVEICEVNKLVLFILGHLENEVKFGDLLDTLLQQMGEVEKQDVAEIMKKQVFELMLKGIVEGIYSSQLTEQDLGSL